MRVPRSGSRPWALSWVHTVLALAVGVGLPLLWLWFTPPAAPDTQVLAQAGASAVQPQAQTPPGGPHIAAAPAPALPPPPPARAGATAQPPGLQISRLRDPNGDQSPDISDFVNAGETPTMAEVIARLQAAGVRSGLGAFNPPGTRPPLVGVAVGAEVVLPPGYVRHHQFTDDGQRIEPILMFSPDHPQVAANALPQDLVVPPALVPPGLPIRQIVVPPAVDSGTDARK